MSTNKRTQRQIQNEISTEDKTSMMEQLFPEIFSAAARQSTQHRTPTFPQNAKDVAPGNQDETPKKEHSLGRLCHTSLAAQPEEDACHCGDPAERTCACGARTCHNHFYDGDGNLAGQDRAGFCAECVDLIREEAAGIARCGRTQ